MTEKDTIMIEFLDYTSPQEPKSLLQVTWTGTGKVQKLEKSVNCLIQDDILVRFFLPRESKKPIFHVVFNPNFIDSELILRRSSLDSVDKKL